MCVLCTSSFLRYLHRMLNLHPNAGIKFIPIEVSTQSENELSLLQCNNSTVYFYVLLMCIGPCNILIKLKNKIQLDATYYFIMLMLGSTCFGLRYAHYQGLTTIALVTT